MKKFVLIILVCVMVFSMSACDGSIFPTEPPVNEGVPAEYTATTYLLDSWREEDEAGSRTYYITLLMYSDDYYDCPTVDDIKYKTDNGYESLVDVIENAKVEVYPMNKGTNRGICTYAKIKTPELMDTKKIYVLLEGAVEYNENVQTMEDYIAINGSADGWLYMMTSVSSKVASIETTSALFASVNSGVVKLCNSNYDQYYYESDSANTVIDGNRMMTRFAVVSLTDGNLEEFVNNIVTDGHVAQLTDGTPTAIELDKRLQIVGEIINGEVWLGFEIVDGSDFSEYDGEIPNAITYTYIITSCFVIS